VRFRDLLNRFRRGLNRITGFSTPLFGVSWTPERLDQDVATEVLLHLEGERVLRGPFEPTARSLAFSAVRSPSRNATKRRAGMQKREEAERSRFAGEQQVAARQTLESVKRLSDYLTDTRDRGGLSEKLARHLGRMRTACGEFVWSVESRPDTYAVAQRKLRHTFGTEIAEMAASYGVDIPAALAPILVTKQPQTNTEKGDG
jgi:hypothetical protein